MDVGEPVRKWVIEPVQNPRKEPAPPVEPTKPEREREPSHS